MFLHFCWNMRFLLPALLSISTSNMVHRRKQWSQGNIPLHGRRGPPSSMLPLLPDACHNIYIVQGVRQKSQFPPYPQVLEDTDGSGNVFAYRPACIFPVWVWCECNADRNNCHNYSRYCCNWKKSPLRLHNIDIIVPVKKRKPPKYDQWILILYIVVNLFVFGLAILNHFMIDPLGMYENLVENNYWMFITTMGNINVPP